MIPGTINTCINHTKIKDKTQTMPLKKKRAGKTLPYKKMNQSIYVYHYRYTLFEGLGGIRADVCLSFWGESPDLAPFSCTQTSHHSHDGLAPQHPPTSQAGFRLNHITGKNSREILNSPGMVGRESQAACPVAWLEHQRLDGVLRISQIKDVGNERQFDRRVIQYYNCSTSWSTLHRL